MMEEQQNIPETWINALLPDVTEINPKLDKALFSDNLEVSFVPMPAVEAETGKIDVSEIRSFGSVKKGYTPFQERDVLFAKITPCMENGKMAVVSKLTGSLGFGSTEFHVLRSCEGIEPEYIYYFVSSKAFRYDAKHNMTGAVGQKRVPTRYLEISNIPLPPVNEQKRIVGKIEELFSALDKGIESLKTARAQLKIYRQAVLKHAFEGKLTKDWREENKDKLESADELLKRIKQEREQRYQQQLEDWNAAVKTWEQTGKEGKKPAKPRKPVWTKDWDFSDLDPLPEGWRYVPFEVLAYSIRNGISRKPDEIGDLKIFRISAVRPMEFDLQDYRRITDATGELSLYRLQQGDLVFTRYNGSRAYVGVSAMYRGDGYHVYPDKLIRCEMGSRFLYAGYLEKATNCGESRTFIEKRIRTTAGQSGVSGGDIKAMPVPLCSPSEQLEINLRLEETLSKASQMAIEIEKQLAKSEALRQSILKKAFSGQLVAQDPADEPASVLLERIKAEKQKPAKTKKKKRKAA